MKTEHIEAVIRYILNECEKNIKILKQAELTKLIENNMIKSL